MSEPTKALADECHRQEENCNYTAVTFLVWLKFLRAFRLVCVAGPVVTGGLATWTIIADTAPFWAAVLTAVTTVVPATYRALKVDDAIRAYTRRAGEFTNLRDRFRQAATIHRLKPYSEYEASTRPLFDRLEKARSEPLTPPDLAFWIARWKIRRRGHYRHDYDERKSG